MKLCGTGCIAAACLRRKTDLPACRGGGPNKTHDSSGIHSSSATPAPLYVACTAIATHSRPLNR